MKRTLKKTMSILLALTLLFGSFALGFADVDWADSVVKVKAEESENKIYTSGFYDYIIENNKSVCIVKCYSLDEEITVPSEINGLPVTGIGQYAFSNCQILKTIIISGNVEHIDDYAFHFCRKLSSVTLGNSLLSIGNQAFFYCDSLETIVIPQNVMSIGSCVFGNCKKLISIVVDPLNKNYSNDEFFALFDKNKTTFIQYPAGNSNSNYEIPNSVSTISTGAFYACSGLLKIKIPENVVRIGDAAFYDCENLVDLTLPADLKSIGSYVFYNCSKIKDICIPKNITNIGEYTFYNCKELTKVSVPNKVEKIGEYAFANCKKVSSVILGNRVNEISDYAFFDCFKIKNLSIPKSIINIGDYNFESCYYLENVYYQGSKEDWEKINIGRNNEQLKNVTIQFNYSFDDPSVPITSNVYESTTMEFITTRPAVTELSTTKPFVESTTKPVVTEPSTTEPAKPIETTKSVETTKPATTVPTTKPVETTKPEPVEDDIINNPSTSTVKYGETLILHADFANIPDGAKIEWSVEGNGVTIAPSADGKTCAVTSTATGDVTITAKYVDANGVEHVSEQEIKSNASFWQKIVSFFKNLFGISRIIEQVIKF